MKENENMHQNNWGKVLLIVGVPFLLTLETLIGTTWRTSITARKPVLEKVYRDSLRHVSGASTDLVNVHRDFNAYDAHEPDIISFRLIGSTDSRHKHFYSLSVYMMVRAKHIIKISGNDSMALELSNGSLISLKAESGQIQYTPKLGKSLPTTEQTVMFEIEEALLDSICNHQIKKISFFNAEETCTVKAREGSSKKMQKRYMLIKDFLETEGKYREDVMIESTETNDPDIVRFAKMKYVVLDNQTIVKIKGYIDKDGNKGFVWDMFIVQKDNAMSLVKANNNVTIHLCDGRKLKTYVYSDGYVLKHSSTDKSIQYVKCRITERQMEEICQVRLADLEIDTSSNPHQVIVPESAADELIESYRALQHYLDGELLL